jgi:hypothetical protein
MQKYVLFMQDAGFPKTDAGRRLGECRALGKRPATSLTQAPEQA